MIDLLHQGYSRALRSAALLPLLTGISLIAAGCGGQSLQSLGVYLCTKTAKNGVCPASTHTLKSFSKQDFVVNAPNGFGVSALKVTIDREGSGGSYAPYDSTQQPVGPATDFASGPAFVWGSHLPWPAGNYRIIVKDGSITLGTWDYTVAKNAKP